MQTDLLEKRKGPDFIIKAIKGTAIFCWSLLIISLLLVDKAKPRIETFFDRLFGVKLASNWNQELLQVNYYVLLGVLCLSIVGLLLNSVRLRRNSDKYSPSLIIMTVLSLLAICFFKLYRLS